MPYYEIIFKDGYRSVAEYEDDFVALNALAKEEPLKVYVYHQHPGALPTPTRDQLIKIVDAHHADISKLIHYIREAASPLVKPEHPTDSVFSTPAAYELST